MSTTLALDASQGLFLSPALLQQAHWSVAGRVSVEIDEQRIVVTPLVETSSDVRLVNKRGRLVIDGLLASSDNDVIASIKAGREQHEDGIAQGCGS